ncbi:MAG TPA: YibE/F family protein [Blastococcus sp.]
MPPSHSHSHGPDPDAPPPTPEALGLRRRAVWLMLLLLVPVALATVLGLFVLWPSGEPTRAQQVAETYLPPGTTYPEARVVSVELHPCGGDTGPQPAQCATAVVEVLDGEGTGDFQQLDLTADVVAAGIKPGDTLVLTRDAGAEGGASYGFFDYARGAPIVVLAIAFAVVVGLVARLRGLASLVGLAFAFFILFQFVLPGLLSEESPTLVSLVGAAAIMFVVLYLAHGFSARTTTALVGTLFGLTLVAVMGSIAVSVARLTGLTSEETVTLHTYDPTLNFSGLVLAGVVVAGLGVLNDVTITQASAIWQLKEVSPDLTWRELYRRGMAVGRDHIASTVYTIVFAYAGAGLPLLLILELYPRPFLVSLFSSAVAEEVIRTLVGAIALVLAVPLTTAIGAFFAEAADTKAGAATERRMTALRARFGR